VRHCFKSIPTAKSGEVTSPLSVSSVPDLAEAKAIQEIKRPAFGLNLRRFALWQHDLVAAPKVDLWRIAPVRAAPCKVDVAKVFVVMLKDCRLVTVAGKLELVTR